MNRSSYPALLLLSAAAWGLVAACSGDAPSAGPDGSSGGASSSSSSGASSGSSGAATSSSSSGELVDDAGAPDADAAVPSADALLLDEIQRATFEYFWTGAHPASGMARERNTSGDTVTTGGTGFGIHAMVVAASRGFVTRDEARARIERVVSFLETADRFHGAWSHWVNGNTGKTIPFSTKDDGGDLVETSFLIHGLLTARAYFSGQDAAEAALRGRITALWEAVDWAHYASKGDGRLYWHWSPTYAWQMNLPIRGYNEALVTYVLALGSPTHPIATSVYTSTWTGSSYENDDTYLGYQLPLGPDYGGPMFFEHYSWLALDPRRLADSHASYWYQAVVHTRINRAWCMQSANASFLYGPNLWGLTASDNPDGYAAQSPTNDNGTIAPTAALSSMPYTPYESMQVARYLRSLGAPAFGSFGFVDALNPSRGWFDTMTLAIDQGPIVDMIENYRSGLLWNLFMQIPEVQVGLGRASLSTPDHATGFYLAVPDATDQRLHLIRHPDRGAYELDVAIHDAGAYSLVVETLAGVDVNVIWNEQQLAKGTRVVDLGALAAGPYLVRLSAPGVVRVLAIEAH